MKKIGVVRCTSPSNIALVKYWGKKPIQIPANASISFSLKNCHTLTFVELQEKTSTEEIDFDFYFDKERKPEFKPKLATFFERVKAYIPNCLNHKMVIHSDNSFPHSSGIASSASAMSALAGCLFTWEKILTNKEDMQEDEAVISEIARLGSGSAARSIRGGYSLWGKYDPIKASSDNYAIGIDKINPLFQDLQDTILLVDVGVKKVSSTVGHQLMNNHHYAEQRFKQAEENITKLLDILTKDDFMEFAKVVEEEALSLHAMMLTSNPSYLLFRPNTIAIIEKIREIREAEGLPICFTLDAGANVHVIYPNQFINSVMAFIEKELLVYCENGAYICDEVGSGQLTTTELYA